VCSSDLTDSSVLCRNTETNKTLEFDADTILLAIGVTPRYAVADALRRCATAAATEVFVVGDAKYPGNIGPAVKSAFRAAAYI
jgi:hypothetical protein